MQGVNTTMFDPGAHAPLDLSGGALVFGNVGQGVIHSKPFRFLSVFKWENRKGWDVLLAGFTEEFRVSAHSQLVHFNVCMS